MRLSGKATRGFLRTAILLGALGAIAGAWAAVIYFSNSGHPVPRWVTGADYYDVTMPQELLRYTSGPDLERYGPNSWIYYDLWIKQRLPKTEDGTPYVRFYQNEEVIDFPRTLLGYALPVVGFAAGFVTVWAIVYLFLALRAIGLWVIEGFRNEDESG